MVEIYGLEIGRNAKIIKQESALTENNLANLLFRL